MTEVIKPVNFYPGLILEWRRISNALSKVVFPLQKEKQLHPALDMYRIYGWCQTHTATGRVTMSEPNLQNIPKDFDVQMPGSLLRFSNINFLKSKGLLKSNVFFSPYPLLNTFFLLLYVSDIAKMAKKIS